MTKQRRGSTGAHNNGTHNHTSLPLHPIKLKSWQVRHTHTHTRLFGALFVKKTQTYAKTGSGHTWKRSSETRVSQALRPSTGAQPAALFGVLAPRLPAAVAAGWARVGMPKLGIFMHHAAQSTMPESWPVYAAAYCHTLENSSEYWLNVDCSIESGDGTVVHAYSTIAVCRSSLHLLLASTVPAPPSTVYCLLPTAYCHCLFE